MRVDMPLYRMIGHVRALLLQSITFLYMRVRPVLLWLWCLCLLPVRRASRRRQQSIGVYCETKDTVQLLERYPERIYESQLGKTRNLLFTKPLSVRGELHWKFNALCAAESQAISVLCIKGGRTCGQKGAVIAPGGELIRSYSGCFLKPTVPHPLMQKIIYPVVKELKGTMGVLNYPASDNYYHWLFNVLPRAHVLLELCDIKIDRYFVDNRTQFQRDTLAALGLKEDVLIQPTKKSHVKCEVLVVPSLLGQTFDACSFLRSRFLPASDKAHAGFRRLYITRSNTRRRRILNEDALVGMLNMMGFEIIDPGSMSFMDQVKVFSEASVVVATHGAALSNIVFCSKNAVVVEMFSPRYVNVCYWQIAQICHLHYHYILGKGEVPPSGKDPLGVYDDIFVCLDDLKVILYNLSLV